MKRNGCVRVPVQLASAGRVASNSSLEPGSFPPREDFVRSIPSVYHNTTRAAKQNCGVGANPRPRIDPQPIFSSFRNWRIRNDGIAQLGNEGRKPAAVGAVAQCFQPVWWDLAVVAMTCASRVDAGSAATARLTGWKHCATPPMLRAVAIRVFQQPVRSAKREALSIGYASVVEPDARFP
jgi:hypothetical protein